MVGVLNMCYCNLTFISFIRKRDVLTISNALLPPHTSEATAAESALRKRVAESNYRIQEVPGDGNCPYSAVCYSRFSDIRIHEALRVEVAKYVLEHKAEYAKYLQDGETIDERIKKIGTPGEYGDNLELHAMAQVLQVHIEIIEGNKKPVLLMCEPPPSIQRYISPDITETVIISATSTP